jgi:peptide/nickel transport system ATP-binding protein
MTAVLDVKGLGIKYHTRDGILTAIRDVDFTVGERQIVGIVGESGCGKSTVAAALLRLLPPNGEISAGRLLFKGQDLRQLTEDQMRDLRGTQISMIFQDPMTSLNPVFSIETQMLDALKAHNPKSSEAQLRARALQMLERVGIPDAERRIKEYPHQFSGGMRQRIMIASALMSNPALLIADEPTSALDVTLEAQIVDLIRGLRDELGTSILYITHDLGVVAQLCDQVVVMYAGNVVEAGDVFNVFDNPKHPYTRALLRSHPSRGHRVARLTTIPGRVPSLRELPAGCKFAPRCAFATERCFQIEPQYLQAGDQRILCHSLDHITAPVQADGPDAETPAPQPHPDYLERLAGLPMQKVVETRDLCMYFYDRPGIVDQIIRRKMGRVQAVDGVTITVKGGETLALVGESGSGKTTLGRVILRLERPTSGDVVVDGIDITRLAQSKIRPMRARMQMIFQDPTSSLSPRMRVSSILMEPFRIHREPVSDPKAKVVELLATVGLAAEQADKYPHQLSGGQARRVGIARALALNPDLLVADEPTSGLDVSVAAGVLNLLKDLRERLNLTYIIITHNLNVISFIADRVAVMYLGKIVELAPTDDIFDHTQHPYTEALMSAIAIPDPHLREARKRIILQGEIPSPRRPPSGCPFHPRCRYAEARCAQEAPPLRSVANSEHLTACHFPERVGSTPPSTA